MLWVVIVFFVSAVGCFVFSHLSLILIGHPRTLFSTLKQVQQQQQQSLVFFHSRAFLSIESISFQRLSIKPCFREWNKIYLPARPPSSFWFIWFHSVPVPGLEIQNHESPDGTISWKPSHDFFFLDPNIFFFVEMIKSNFVQTRRRKNNNSFSCISVINP
jgi:hypothetical protein